MRAYLSGLTILWSRPLICRFAHSIKKRYWQEPIFSRVSRIMRRNVDRNNEDSQPIYLCRTGQTVILTIVTVIL
jgi:hypothetical protein